MLRDYQQKIKNDIYASMNAGNRNVLAVSPTGSGKTLTMQSVTDDSSGMTMSIAHRRELVGQISMAAARAGVYHRIIAPNAIVSLISSWHTREFGRSFIHPGSSHSVASIDTINSRADDLKKLMDQIRLWQMDECFPAGTLVRTPGGDVPIEGLVVGDAVVAHRDGVGFAVKRVKAVMCSAMPDVMVKIAWTHHEIECTSGHPIWTRRGWVRAAYLREGDHVLMHAMRCGDSQDQGTSAVPISQNGKHLLPDPVRDDLARCTAHIQGSEGSCVLGMFDADHQALSQHDVCGLCENSQVPCFVGNDDQDESHARITTDAPAQPDAYGRGTSENASDTEADGSSPNGSRWQRAAADHGGVDVDAAVRHDGSARGSNRETEGFGLSVPLQDRCGNSRVEIGGRSGRSKSFDDCAESSGPEENGTASWVRVDSVTFHQSSDFERNTSRRRCDLVYNIEVEDFHTYIAGGIVVHNCHHVQKTNKWGRGILTMPNAYGVGWTATPLRADRKPLRRDPNPDAECGGLFDAMVLGPDVRELIDAGHLADYEIYGPPLAIDVSNVEIGADGDYKRGQLHDAAEKSTITGDIVDWYLKLAAGKVGATFVVDLGFAEDTTARYLHYGVPAAMISATTPDAYRGQVMADLRCGIIKQVVNVDILGEGVDVPGLEVVSQGRPTESFALNRQQQGRAMRPKAGGKPGIIIDHVGNTDRHGPPDRRMVWSLDAPERRKRGAARDPDEIPIRRCGKCWRLSESWGQACVYCGDVPPVVLADRPAVVEGNLLLYTPELLKALGAEASRVTGGPQIPRGASPLAIAGIEKQWKDRAAAQIRLRGDIAWWAGVQRDVYGRGDTESYIRFTRLFGVDVATAQTVNAAKARELSDLIWKDIGDDLDPKHAVA